MMNLFTAQEQLRDLSKGQLVQEMQSPSGSIPPFLIMTELQRRTRMENAAALDKGPPQTTVMQDTVNAAGVPQGGLATMAQAMAPKTSMAQNDSAVAQQGQLTPQATAPAVAPAPVQPMQEGGLAGIKRNVSDYKAVLDDPAFSTLATRSGMTPEDYYASISAAAQAQNRARVSRNRMLALEPSDVGRTFPTQRDLDQRYAEDAYGLGRALPRTGGIDTNDAVVPSSRPASGVPNESPRRLYTGPRDELDVVGGDTATFPTQRDLDQRYMEEKYGLGRGLSRTGGVDINDIAVPGGMVDSALPVSPPLGLPEDLRDVLAPGRTMPRPTVDMSGGPGFRPGSPARAPVDMSGGPGFRDETALERARMNAQLGPEAPSTTSPFVDPDAAPYESLERFLFPGRDPAEIRTRRQAASDAFRATNPDAGIDPLSPNSTGIAPSPTIGGIDPLGPNVVEAATPVADPAVPERVADPLAPNTVAPDAPVGPTGAARIASAPPPVTDQDRMFEQDKWLALARFGAALAASKAPTFGQAIGEAGQVGLDALGAARADYQKRKQEAEIMAMKRAAASGRGGGGGGGGLPVGIGASQNRLLDRLESEISDVAMELGGLDTGGMFSGPDARIPVLTDRLRQLEDRKTLLLDIFAGGFAPGMDSVYSMDDVTE